MDEDKTAANEQETNDAAKAGAETTGDGAGAGDDASFVQGLQTGTAADAGTKKADAQKPEAKADAAAAETAAKADTKAEPAVTGKETENPAGEKEKPAEEKAKPDESAAKLEALTKKAEKQQTRLRDSMAKAAAYEAGIRPDRVDKAVLLAGISGIDPTADDAEEKFKTALQAVADDMPEFTAPPAGTGSPGAFARTKDVKKDAFVRGLTGEK